MNCTHCGKRPAFSESILLIQHGHVERLFCNEHCLAAWLYAKARLTAPNPAGEISGLSPQPIVVPTPELEPREGESAVAYLQRLMEYGLLEKG